ncbi:hypothetical protein [Streptomyces sp. NPDC059761]|uniref:hypothetical protein n=1 Tax=Streptomyces sp. NPDC059761 TaxID=3346937 RepID=UPI00364E36D0
MVQQFGLELLILADGWAAGEKRTEQLRLALVASGVDPEDVFTDRFQPQEVDPADDEGRDFDYSAVDWQDSSADDWEQLQEALASTRVKVGDDVPSDFEPAHPAVPDVDFDREWQ